MLYFKKGKNTTDMQTLPQRGGLLDAHQLLAKSESLIILPPVISRLLSGATE